MLMKIRNRQQGFPLIELLIVVAIIGIIAALLIPNFLDALQKAKQKRTVADARNVGTAEMSWLTDQISAAAAGFSLDDYSGETDIGTIRGKLVPQYIQELQALDAWTPQYKYWLETTDSSKKQIMAICSQGKAGSGCPGDYSAGGFEP